MNGVTSSEISVRTRKRPEERREEILEHAAAIALDEGLERITLRAVADRLGVRPGLITHYFPAAESMVIEAFTRAAVAEREQFFTASGSPLERVAHFVGHIERGASLPLARMWLNARHLARFSPALDEALQEQDALDRERLTAIIEDGIASGAFRITDAATACIRILIAVDGGGSYVNTATPPTHPAHRHVVADVSEWALGLEPGTLRAAIDAESPAPAR
ncbi:TetR/AcrR family transcriptional regulator [Microbacterium sp. NPDC056044]|uniref:TetR/AcrR family transcriptional regulator n=1 Tax=Microbacterium sp. NPDC056044 TaxID=3345690 RepID=UPI0035DBDBF6